MSYLHEKKSILISLNGFLRNVVSKKGFDNRDNITEYIINGAFIIFNNII